MPIHNIQTNEYECGYCGWRWINRKNGKDGPIPKCCANCKRTNWNDPRERISSYEIGLRRRIKEFNKEYEFGIRIGFTKDIVFFPMGLSKKFLEITPRPTIKELYKVVYPLGYELNSKSWVPHPTRPGKSMRNPNMDNLKIRQLRKRQEYMIEIIKSRGIDYDPTVGLLAAEKWFRERILGEEDPIIEQ